MHPQWICSSFEALYFSFSLKCSLLFFLFCLQTEPFKTIPGCGRPLSRSLTPTHPIISTMRPPLTPWTGATTHRGVTQVPLRQTALPLLRVRPVGKTAHRTTGYSTATSPWKPGTVQPVSLTMYRDVGENELVLLHWTQVFMLSCSVLNYHTAIEKKSNIM